MRRRSARFVREKPSVAKALAGMLRTRFARRKAGLPAVATAPPKRVKRRPSPSLRTAAFVLAVLGEGWSG